MAFLNPQVIASPTVREVPNFVGDYQTAKANSISLQDARQKQKQVLDLQRLRIQAGGDTNKYIQSAQAAGYDMTPQLKAQADLQSTQATANKTNMDIAEKGSAWLDNAVTGLKGLGSNVTVDNFAAAADDGVARGLITNDVAQRIKSEAQANASNLPAYINSVGLRGAGAEKAMSLTTPNIEFKDNGGTNDAYSIDKLNGTIKPLLSVAKTNDPNAILSSNTSIRNNTASNAVSTANNIRSTNATLTGQQLTAQTAANKQTQSGGKNAVIGSPQFAKTENARLSQLSNLITEAKGILPDATNSGVGAAADFISRGFGHSTKGDLATGRLQTIAGQLTAMMPRMEGPQSDKDVALYKQMAGDVANSSLPSERRLAALDQIQKINSIYADSNTQNGIVNPWSKGQPSTVNNPFTVQQNGNKTIIGGRSYSGAELERTAKKYGKTVEQIKAILAAQ